MSESGAHAHAPHEEALEHLTESKNHTLNQWVAIFTALLAAFGAIVSYQGSQLMNEVLLHKNEAVLKKAHATDEWNYYQAVSTKQHLMELARDLAPLDKQAGIAAKITKYDGQKTQIKARADALEAASNKANETSDRLNRPHTGMARSLIFLQIAISLASITALTGRKWLFGVAVLSALAGVGLWLTALGWVAG
jgi:hypothetical protein